MRIVVRDEGIGIAAQDVDRIFNAFEQADAKSHRFGGLGLGLSISKALATLHGGSLTAESPGVGHGATFTLELPIVARKINRTPSGSAAPAERRPLRLLVVEDHEPTAEVMERLLKKRGYSVTVATSIREALERLEGTPVDLLVSDVGLPDGTGHELMKEVRKKRETPGIALSGYGTEADVAQSAEVGFAAHLTKPIDIDRLDREIQTVFRDLPA